MSVGIQEKQLAGGDGSGKPEDWEAWTRETSGYLGDVRLMLPKAVGRHALGGRPEINGGALTVGKPIGPVDIGRLVVPDVPPN